MAWAYVGGTTGAGTGASYAVSLNGTLTGGLASSPAEGDLVVVMAGHGNTAASAPNVTGNNSGAYTGIGTAIHANDTWDTEARPFYRVMGATPDTSLTITRTNTTTYGGATVVQVWRGADTTNPFIGTTQTSGTNGCVINCPAYNPAVADSLIFAAGAGTMAATSSDYTGISGMSNFLTRKGDGSTSDCAVAMATYAYAGSSYDPAAISGGTTSTSSSWAGFTFAFRMYVPPAQGLTPALFDDSTDTWYAPTIVPGAVGLAPALFDDSADTWYAPDVTQSGNAQSLTPDLFDDSTDTWYAPTLTTGVLLAPPRLDNEPAWYAPALSSSITLTATRYDNEAAFHAPTVAMAVYVLSPPRIDNAPVFYDVTVTPGAIVLSPAFLDTTGEIYAPIVGQSGGTQYLLPPYIESGIQFYAPAVATDTAAITFDDWVESGWVESGWVAWPHFNATQFFGATVAAAQLPEATPADIAAAVLAALMAQATAGNIVEVNGSLVAGAGDATTPWGPSAGTYGYSYTPPANVADIVAAVLEAINSTAIPVDIRKVNNTTITGSGTSGDPWGPV